MLLSGPSGTGKELVARAVHNLSPLHDRPFIVCNCTTLAPTLLESELFGHVRGAFTGATEQRAGVFEVAHNGTLIPIPLSSQTSSSGRCVAGRPPLRMTRSFSSRKRIAQPLRVFF